MSTDLVGTKIRCGVAGVGSLGQHHARIYAGLPNVEFVGIFETNDDRATEICARHGCARFATLEELGAACDAVSVVVPTDLHEKVALPLLAAAQLELSEGKPAAAIAPARRAVALRSAPGQDAVSRAQAEFTLARALAPDSTGGVTTESLELARAAQTHYGESPEHEAARAEVQAWLAERGVRNTTTR